MRKTEELVEALCAGNSKFVLVTLGQGTNPNALYRGRPLLMWAIQERQMRIAKVLVRAGASVKKKDCDGFTPLDQAVGEGDAKMVSFLLKAGANVNQRSTNGTPLHTACVYGHHDVVRLLIAHGANVRALDDEGQAPADLVSGRASAIGRSIRKMLEEPNAAS